MFKPFSKFEWTRRKSIAYWLCCSAFCLTIYLQVTFNMKVLRLLTVSITLGVMMVNIGTGVATVYIAFSSSRNAASIERKILQYTILSMKLRHFILSQVKTQFSTPSDVLACLSLNCADHKQQSNPDFSTKSVDDMLQTCVDIANEYMQAYNAGAGVKNYVFCSLHQCK